MRAPGQPSNRHAAFPAGPARAGRWLLIGLLTAGVIAMHVLSEHETGGGHGVIMDSHPPSAVPTVVNHAPDHLLGDPMAMIGSAAAWAMPASLGDGMSMSSCVLYLVGGSAWLLMLLCWARRTDSNTLMPSVSTMWGLLPRGPPGPRAPRISLCILRV